MFNTARAVRMYLKSSRVTRFLDNILWCRSLRGRLICAVAKLALEIKFFYICGIFTIPLEDHLVGSEQVISACLGNNQGFSRFTKLGLNQCHSILI